MRNKLTQETKVGVKLYAGVLAAGLFYGFFYNKWSLLCLVIATPIALTVAQSYMAVHKDG